LEKNPLLYALLGLAVTMSAGGLVAAATFPLATAGLCVAGGLGALIGGMGLASVISNHFTARSTSGHTELSPPDAATPAAQLDQLGGPVEPGRFADRIRTASQEAYHGQSR
jgi:hypothetical protein